MASLLLQLSLCVVIAVQLTSSRSVPDTVRCSEQMVSQLLTAVSQLQKDVAELKAAPRGNCLPVLVLQNYGSASFNRSWDEYKIGFNDTGGNYWIGNEVLHQLTFDGRYKLRFDLQSYRTGLWYQAEYSTFFVFNEANNYRLRIGGFTGNASYNAMAYQNGMMFTTYDRDNDWAPLNCAGPRLPNTGGFWYNNCYHCCTTCWGTGFDWLGLPGGTELRMNRMWLMCR